MKALKISAILSTCLWLLACTVNQKRERMSYKNWQPAIAPASVYEKFVFFLYLHSFENRLFWVEGRPDENGRYVIVMQKSDGSIVDVTPKGFSARSKVYEYGGFPYTVQGDNLYFVNFEDQRIYWQNLNELSEVKPLTPKKNEDKSQGKYMELAVSPNGKWLSFVYEKEVDSEENPNYLGVLNIETKNVSKPIVIAKGADFYKKPIFSSDGKEWRGFSGIILTCLGIQRSYMLATF